MDTSAAHRRIANIAIQEPGSIAVEKRKLPTPKESIAEERKSPKFSTRELTFFLDGGQSMTAIRERMMLQLERDPLFRLDDMHDLTKPQIRERTMEKFKSLVYYLQNEPTDIFRMRMEIISVIDPGFWTRFGVHYGLFFGTLSGSATPSQFAHWVSKGALTLQGMVGCFAMTELGHGSNVAGLETTATFDEASDQFVIHTPRVESTKWWIGGAAQSATHCCVFARLIVKGVDHGVKSFVVQLRDPRTFSLMPGINIGDIGKKMGRDGIDNGWIQFTHVRIPRSHMLMKHTKVSRDGIVQEPPLAQLTYGALIQGRVSMVVDSGNVAKKALTIAIRYAAVRRQGGNGPVETKLLDYRIHQYRLLPLLAQAYAMHMTGIVMKQLYENLMNKLNTAKPEDSNMQDVLNTLKETHATSAGLKAFCTWSCLSTIEVCRQSLGGHGYSAYAGLAGMASDFAVHCTWEGDNTILTLQAGRYLVSCYNEAKQGKVQPEGVAYLNNLTEVVKSKCSAKTPEDMLDFGVIERAWSAVAANVVQKAGEDFAECRKKGLKTEQAYEECSAARLHAGKIHSYSYLFRTFVKGISTAPASLRPQLDMLCRLYGLYTIAENSGPFLQSGHLSALQMDWVRANVDALCRQVRDQAVLLVDSFNYTDYVINSPLGRYDGDVYERYYDQVKRANPPQPHPYFDKIIKPLLTSDSGEQDELEMDEDDD